MRKMTELPRICVGVDLHKLQFTVHAMNEETGEVMLTDVYRTDSQGYKDFCNRLHSIEAEEECRIELAVEATGNARYFKNKMEAEGFGGCTNIGECAAVCPKQIPLDVIATLNRQLGKSVFQGV